jgi:hypothetical protein
MHKNGRKMVETVRILPLSTILSSLKSVMLIEVGLNPYCGDKR